MAVWWNCSAEIAEGGSKDDHESTVHPPVPLLRSDDLGLGWQHGEGIVTFKKHGILGNRMRCLICRRCGAVLFQWVAEPPPIR